MVTLTPYGEGGWVGPDGFWAIRRTKSHIPRKWGKGPNTRPINTVNI